MSLDRTLIERSNYTFLDLLSDLGGLDSTLLALTAVFLTIFKFANLETYMASKLFLLMPENAFAPDINSSDAFSTEDVSGAKEYFIDLLPSWLLCCKRTRK